MSQPLILLDSSLPYLEGLVEQVARVKRLASRDFTPEAVREADALIIRSVVQVDQHLLAGSRVRVVATATAGFDHIDTSYCEAQGIHWSNSPGCNAEGVVQYVLSALAHWSLDRKRSLQGLTLGIVGVGQVGGRLAKRASALGLNILCCDPLRVEQEGLEDFVSFETILRESDIISLHVPLSREGKYPTYGMVNDETLALCQRRPLLINACRGAVTCTQDVLRALDSDLLSDIIIDCWEGEPQISRELAQRAFLATPHIAGWSSDGKWRGSMMALTYTCQELGLPLPQGTWDTSVLPTPERPSIDLDAFPEGERLLRALLHTSDLRPTSDALRQHPEDFEHLRRSYTFPREASAFHVYHAKSDEVAPLTQLGFTEPSPEDSSAIA